MGQTIGIAPAKYATFTPFKYLVSIFEPADDVANQKSLFMTQVDSIKRAKELSEKAKEEKECILIAADEPLSGTNQHAATGFLKRLVHFFAQSHSVFAFTTHNHEVTQLEKEKPKTCTNVHVEAFINEQGDVVYPYTIKPGPSTFSVVDAYEEKVFGSK